MQEDSPSGQKESHGKGKTASEALSGPWALSPPAPPQAQSLSGAVMLLLWTRETWFHHCRLSAIPDVLTFDFTVPEI